MQPLAAEIRRRLGPPPQASDWPLVSLVVLNRDGAPLLRRLLAGLSEYTDYPSVELILVDNASGDDSLEFIRRVEAPFPISIVANAHNESFSDGCNQGAALARGELLLFLNNDVEPFEPGWLRELVACRESSGAAAVAATLLCREEEHQRTFEYGYGVQHRGLTFCEQGEMIHPTLRGWEADPLDEDFGRDVESTAVAAACLLIGRDAFQAVGGFSRGYVYGAEDVDLCLKLGQIGKAVRCSGRAIAIHHPVSTRRTAPFEEERARKLANHRTLWVSWGPQLRRRYELEQGHAGAEALSFCFKVAEPDLAPDLEQVVAGLRDSGRRCLLLTGERAEDLIGLNYDVAVHVAARTRYIPKPAQLNLLWTTDAVATPPVERSRYDGVVDERTDLVAVVEAMVGRRASIQSANSPSIRRL